MSQKFKSQIDAEQGIKITNQLYDGSAASGSSGQVLSSTGSATQWIDSNSETAERIEVTVKNVSGGSLAKGVVVHASPTASPPSGNLIEVIAADANVVASMPAIGVLNETIADDAEGKAVMFGAVSGIDTSSFTAGVDLYVSETAGAFTATKPTASTSQIQKIAVVIKSHASNGLIKVFGAGRANDVPNRVDRNMNFTDDSELTFGDSDDASIKYDSTASQLFIGGESKFLNDLYVVGDFNLAGNVTSDLIFGRAATRKIVFNSDVNFGSDNAFLYFNENSSFHRTGTENVRFSIGTFNDFSNSGTHSDALDLQGGARLFLNAGNWDAELDSAIGDPSTGAFLDAYPMQFAVNNDMKVRMGVGGDFNIKGITQSNFLNIGSYTGDKINSSTLPDTPAEHLINLAPPSDTNYYGGGISWSESANTAASIGVYDAGGTGALGFYIATGNNTTLTQALTINDSQEILLTNTHSKSKIKLIGNGTEWIGSSANTLELSGVSINLNGGSGTGATTLKNAGITHIDTNHNVYANQYFNKNATTGLAIYGFGNTNKVIDGVNGATYFRASGTSTLCSTHQAGQIILASGLAYGAVNNYTQIINGSTGAISGTSATFSGSVGIGGNTPSSLLMVGDAGTAPNGIATISLTGPNTVPQIASKPGMYHRHSIGLGLYSDYKMTFEVDGATSLITAMTIDDDGQVGIGIDPACKLDVNGIITPRGNAIRLAGPTDANHFLQKFTTGYSSYTIDGPMLQGHQGGELTTNLGGNEWALRWATGGKVYINNQLEIGTVGVGVVGLEVNGGADAVVKITGTSTAARLDLATTSYHVFMQLLESDGRYRIYNQNTSNEYLTILNSGNVGIGITPNASYSKLQVKAPASSYGFDLVGRDAGINGESQITFWNSNQTTQLAAIFNTADNLGFVTGTTERMRIHSNGRVSMGSDTTIAAANNLTLTHATGAEIDINCTGGHSYRLTSDTSDSFIITDKTVNTERMRINSSGNATFAGMITVNGDGIDIDNNDNLRLRFYNASVFKAGLQVATSTGDMIEGSAANDFAIRSQSNMLFATGGSTEKMRIDSSGLVRIQKNTASTTEPLLKLSNANGSTTDGVKMIFEVANTSGNGGEIAVVRDGGSFNPYMTFNVSSGVASAPTERMRIDSSGNASFAQNVGIPTGKSIYFATLSDPNWRIGRNIHSYTNSIVTANSIDILAHAGSAQGFSIGANNATQSSFEIVHNTDNAHQFFMRGYVGINQTATLANRKFYSGGGYYLSGGGYNSGGYTADGLFGSTATPNVLQFSSGRRVLLGYTDNGSGLYAETMAIETHSTDGLGNTVEKNAFLIKNINSGNHVFTVTNTGTVHCDSYLQINNTTRTDTALNINGHITGVSGSGYTTFFHNDPYHGICLRGSPNAYNSTVMTPGDVMSFMEYSGDFRFYQKKSNGTLAVQGKLLLGTWTVSGDIIAFGQPSDISLKENIKPIDSALNKAMKLQGVTFDWKQKEDNILDIKQDIGFIAQDVQKVVPELVRKNDNGLLSLRHQGIAPILLEAIKELKAEVDSLRNEIKELKK